MPILKIKDADGNDVYMNVTGSGTAGDPYKCAHVLVDQDGTPIDVAHGALVVNISEYFMGVSVEHASSSGGDISETIITPTSGKKLGILNVFISTEATTGLISLDVGAMKVARVWPSKGVSPPAINMHMEGIVDAPLVLTGLGIGNVQTVFVMISYVEED